MSAQTTVERLSIDVPGNDAGHGRRIGELVPELLAPLLGPEIDPAALDQVRVELTARPGESPEALAQRIASAIALAVAGAERLEAGR